MDEPFAAEQNGAAQIEVLRQEYVVTPDQPVETSSVSPTTLILNR